MNPIYSKRLSGIARVLSRDPAPLNRPALAPPQPIMPDHAALPEPFAGWFARRGWTPHPHQLDLLDRGAEPATLLVAPTGGGKTLAGLPPLARRARPRPAPGLHTLYVSPLKALAADIGRNLRAPLAEMGLASASRTAPATPRPPPAPASASTRRTSCSPPPSSSP